MNKNEVFRTLQNAGQWSTTKISVGLFLVLCSLGTLEQFPMFSGVMFFVSGVLIGEVIGVDNTRLAFAKSILGEEEYHRRMITLYTNIY